MSISVFLAAFLAATASSSRAEQTIGEALPADFRDHRVLLVPRLEDGRTLTFFTDTGGGFNAISELAVERLGLPLAEPLQGENGPVPTVAFPGFANNAGIPAPPADNWMERRLVVAPADRMTEDGFLGGRYFGDGIWDFDYAARTLKRQERARAWRGASEVALGFQTKADGQRTTHFPRIAVIIDCETIDMLLDTGASATLTAASGEFLRRPAGTVIGTSFIVQEIFDRWRSQHPDWPVIEAGDALQGAVFPMIRVPSVTLAGIKSGPVWFTVRPNPNFDEYMSRFMDAPVRGAIGGSALKYYRMQIDYPGARAFFSRVR